MPTRPRFQPRDLAPPNFDPRRPGRIGTQPDPHQLRRTSRAPRRRHAVPARSRNGGFEARPSGNAVSLEDEMMKVANNQMDYQAATSLYTRGLGMLKTAIGRR